MPSDERKTHNASRVGVTTPPPEKCFAFFDLPTRGRWTANSKFQRFEMLRHDDQTAESAEAVRTGRTATYKQYNQQDNHGEIECVAYEN